MIIVMAWNAQCFKENQYPVICAKVAQSLCQESEILTLFINKGDLHNFVYYAQFIPPTAKKEAAVQSFLTTRNYIQQSFFTVEIWIGMWIQKLTKQKGYK